ncbi:MAG TPA: hypothetical protein PK513_03085 [Alphaproteobacteria bacterium]|nr:hypothetical protein [Alphaproteobacteria bacterium]USO06266.1 MAG: hypothetical protein H6859_03480 [Rhodospirillales bacterium]HOO81470.1 hypothetical protein [Alphaproteobacteria bacterium]
MSQILEALVKLEQSIGGLEGSVSHIEASLSGQQRDMFSASRPVAANGNGVDTQTVVKKLDNIIEQAETVLKESHG